MVVEFNTIYKNLLLVCKLPPVYFTGNLFLTLNYNQENSQNLKFS